MGLDRLSPENAVNNLGFMDELLGYVENGNSKEALEIFMNDMDVAKKSGNYNERDYKIMQQNLIAAIDGFESGQTPDVVDPWSRTDDTPTNRIESAHENNKNKKGKKR